MNSRLVLERQEFTNESIIGSFYIDGEFVCYSLERPWIDNVPNISCVPEGVYELVYHKYKNRTDTFALKGGTVSHYPNDEFARNLILIHPANYPHELQGCIATGKDKDTDRMIDSGDAFKVLINNIISKNIDTIEII